MSKIHLVDILHGQGLFVDPRLNNGLAKLFQSMKPDQQRVALCVEGIKLEFGNVLKPTDSIYRQVISRYWPSLAKSGSFPLLPLYGNEPRSQVDAEANMAAQTRLQYYYQFLDHRIVLHEKPKTIEESVTWIQENRQPFTLSLPPDGFIQGIAQEVIDNETRWLANYSELATQLAESHDHVYILSGAAHSLALHVQHGWPIEWITRQLPNTTPEWVYRWYMNQHGFAERILMTPARIAA